MGLWQDLRIGARMLAKNPGFAVVAVLTLSLGIGANTAIFSVVNAVLLKPLPYRDAERIVVGNISPPDYRDVKQANQVFDRMAMWASNLYNLTIGNETAQELGAVVGPEFFPLLGDPLLGRAWTPEEETQPLAVISHNLWQNRFGADPNIIGRTIRLYATQHTIIGVMPPAFQYPTQEFKLWAPLGHAMAATPRQMENRQLRIFRAVAHLKPGVTPAQVQAEMNGLSQRLAQEYPETNSGVQFNFVPLEERLVGDLRRPLFVLLSIVGLVLLIACANVANLQLARAAVREREMAVRAALGAGRTRLLRQLLTENLLLSALGGAIGLLLASWGLDLLSRLIPNNIPRLTSVGLDSSVLLFTLGISALTGCLFGLAPAWQLMRVDLNQSLKDGGRGALGQARGRWMRGGLVVAEVALSFVVLIGAGLLLRSFVRLMQVDAGVAAGNLLTANVGLVQYKEADRRLLVQREMIDRIARLPGVVAVGGGTGLPPRTPQRGTRFAVDGMSNDNVGERTSYFIAVSPDYFRALGTPLIEGRAFSDRDDGQSGRVVVLSRTLARRLFPNESAVGKRLQLVNPEQSNEWREVIGVVGDVRYSGLEDAEAPTIYTPFAQTPFIWTYLMIRTATAPESLAPSVRQAVASVDPTLEAANFRTMEQLVSEAVTQPRFYTSLLGMFAALALLLSAIGIYGLISYSVAQRTREIGIRMALGAGMGDALWLVLKQGMLLVCLGIALGLGASLGLTRLMGALLFEVSAHDPATFAATAVFLALVALLSCYLPARRAMRVDPMVALRYE